MERTQNVVPAPAVDAAPDGVVRLLEEGRDLARYARYLLDEARLAPAEYAELRLHAEAFRQLAVDLCAIVQGERPPVCF